MTARRLRQCQARIVMVSGLALCTWTTIGQAADVSGGLYRDGQLVDALTQAPPVSGASPARSLSTISPSTLAARPGGDAPRISPETQERNKAFAIAARRAAKIHGLLRRLEAPQHKGTAARPRTLRKLSQLLRLYTASENEMRTALAKVGARIVELGLGPAIYGRHLTTVETFEKGAAALANALSAVLRGEDGAVARARELMEQLKFRADTPLLSSGLPYDMHVETAPVVDLQQGQSAAASRGAPGSADQRMAALAPPPLQPPPPAAADLAATVDVQLTPEIQSKASALANSPVAIYEFVRNSVAFQPYLGSRKGSAETLKQLRGNDTDQASLLLALLRASGIPSRYVRGTVEIDPQRAMSWLGVDDASTAASILTTAGLDGVAVVNGPNVVAVRCTHVWVEAYVPYGNYRGVPNDSTGKIWVPLDPSFKGSSVTPGMDVLASMGFNIDAYLANYISTFHAASPIEKLGQDIQAYLNANNPGKTVGDIERTTAISPQNLGILPGSLPSRVLSISAHLSELEDAKRYKVRFHLYDGPTNFIDYMANLPEIIGKRVTIQYVGATAGDQATIDSFGGIYETPPYLVNVKPILKLDNVAVATSMNSIGMGYSHSSDMQFIQPAGASNVQPLVQNSIIAGNGQAIGLDTFLDVDDALIGDQPFPPDVFLESMLHGTARDYLSRVDRGHEQAGRLMGVVTTEDVSEAIVENSIAVAYSFGTPVTFEWTGLTVDADRRIIGPFAVNGAAAKARPYMILTGMDASTMENRVFEDRFAQRAISTIKILELASDAAIPICTVTTSIGSNCPGTTQPAFIQSAVNSAAAAGHVVTIPKHPITVGMWSGTGYIDMQPATGAAGYIISGGISGGVQSSAGGATVDQWPVILSCEATSVTGQALQPPADSPDPSAVFCADDTTITFAVRLMWTCKDGSMQTKDVTLTTHKTKKQFGGGNYALQLVAFGTTTIRHIMIIAVNITPMSMTAAEGLDSGSFTCNTLPPLNGATYKWKWAAPAGAGNSPVVNFSDGGTKMTANALQTRWFALPNDRHASVTPADSVYDINCETTLAGLTCMNMMPPAKLTVRVETSGGSTSWPQFTGVNLIQVSKRAVGSNTEWFVSAQGGFSRTAPVKTVNRPLTSQFYARTDAHESKHVTQWNSESPWKDLFNANDLFNSTIKNLTSTVVGPDPGEIGKADLRAKIALAVDARNNMDAVTATNTKCAREIAGWAVGNAVAPPYMQLDASEVPAVYGCTP